MNTVTLALSNSTFTYDGRPVNNIDIQAHGRVNQTRAEIQELVLRSPVAEAHLTGVMDDWRALHYQMNITSSVDLTQLSDVLQAGTTLRGTGNFAGVVSGEGDKYKVEGSINSDSLAADNLRLQGLSVTAKGSGQGKLRLERKSCGRAFDGRRLSTEQRATGRRRDGNGLGFPLGR
jgi:autotransporter translocation and assembly factor TamB